MRVAIVGAGIGGLTAALALSQRGLVPFLVERSPVLEEAGAGIQLSPNAIRVLERLGLGEALRRTMVESRAIIIRRGADGRDIMALPLGNARSRWGAPYATIRRADLQAALVKAVAEAGVEMTLGQTFSNEGARLPSADSPLHLETESALGARAFEVDAIIGADGALSSVRARMGLRTSLTFQKKRAHRAIVPRERVPRSIDAGVTGLWLGEDAHLVHYPVSSGSALNVVAVVRDDNTAQGWSRPSNGGEVAVAFARWAKPIRDLIASAGDFHSWPLYDRPPDTDWTRGRVALLGDAAHPMLPFLAQGGAMAIEDAAVLASRLSEDSGAVAQRLARYAADRQPRTGRVQSEARANGDRYHWGAAKSAVRDLGLSLLGPERMLARYDWIYRWSPP